MFLRALVSQRNKFFLNFLFKKGLFIRKRKEDKIYYNKNDCFYEKIYFLKFKRKH